MDREELLKIMDEAAKQDRERFFTVADTLHLQPKYGNVIYEVNEIKQQWRDMTLLYDYPNIDFPLVLPDWFPKINFASSWKKDIFIEQSLKTK